MTDGLRSFRGQLAASRAPGTPPEPGEPGRRATVTPIHARRGRPALMPAAAARAAAATSRRAYVRRLTSGRTSLSDGMRTAIARHVAVLGTSTSDGYAVNDPVSFVEWLGVIVDPHGTGGALERSLGDAMQALEDDPHQVLLAGLASTQEAALDPARAWEPANLSRARGLNGPRAWLELLSGPLGYPLTDWERDQLAAADRLDADHRSRAGAGNSAHFPVEPRIV